MKRFIRTLALDALLLTVLALAGWLLLTLPSKAQIRVQESRRPANLLVPGMDPALAVAKIPSHGASATVIYSDAKGSWLLGCCHMFYAQRSETIDPERLRAPLKTEGPKQPYSDGRLVYARLVGYDAQADLSLIWMPRGGMWWLPVAPAANQLPQKGWTVGYDKMCWPPKKRPATILGSDGRVIFTRERPWHGRSGGLLVGLDNYQYGVVEAYEGNPQTWTEVDPRYRGIHVGHRQILAFLGKHAPGLIPGGAPRVQRPVPPFRLGTPDCPT